MTILKLITSWIILVHLRNLEDGLLSPYTDTIYCSHSLRPAIITIDKKQRQSSFNSNSLHELPVTWANCERTEDCKLLISECTATCRWTVLGDGGFWVKEEGRRRWNGQKKLLVEGVNESKKSACSNSTLTGVDIMELFRLWLLYLLQWNLNTVTGLGA